MLEPGRRLGYNVFMAFQAKGCCRPRALWTALVVAALALATSTALAQADQAKSSSQDQSAPDTSSAAKTDKAGEPATTRLKIVVTDPHEKPVGNASVYVRFNETVGMLHKDKLVEMNFKTNEDGTVKVPEIPQGKILIQVVAKGWHTYGKWYDIEKAEDTLQIKLDPPPHWY
ncbi:MAG TPA: carboxypeptidase-like regulatory domain-containing protein [Candidatus Cybelea sp.]|nr:carboxypeptidase-like regulatory domain-containing protein [Candidatus Cybelea sp.]